MLEINLLPKQYKRRGNVLNLDRQVIYAAIGVAAVVVMMAGVTTYQRFQVDKMDKMITKARIEEMRYKKDIAIIDALTEVKEKILARVSAIERLDHRRTFYISLLEDLNARLPEFLWLTKFEERPPSTAAKATAAQQPGQPPAAAAQASQEEVLATMATRGTAEIEGYAHSLNSIGAFIIGLMKSEFFDNIKLDRAFSEEVGKVTAYNFKLRCDLNYDAQFIQDEFEDTAEGLELSSMEAAEDPYDIDYNYDDPDL